MCKLNHFVLVQKIFLTINEPNILAKKLEKNQNEPTKVGKSFKMKALP